MKTVTPQRKPKKILLGFFLPIFLVSVSSSFAQSLGNVAREERDRQAGSARRPRVYTNEDLARFRIVVPEGERDNESAFAVSNETSTEQTSPRPLPTIWPNNIPLGDIARFYRRQRELELARGAQFAVHEPPVLDMDFLLPSPLASPLPDLSNRLLAPPSIPEPVWDAFIAPTARFA